MEMYRIDVDVVRHRIVIDFLGSYSVAGQARLEGDLKVAAQRAKGGGAWFDMLVDFTRSGVMPQDLSAESQNRIEWCIANGLRKSANITSSTLMKMQIARLANSDSFRMFATAAEAMAWLDETA